MYVIGLCLLVLLHTRTCDSLCVRVTVCVCAQVNEYAFQINHPLPGSMTGSIITVDTCSVKQKT